MAETNEEPGAGTTREGSAAVPPAPQDSPPSTATPLSIKCPDLTNGGLPRNGTTLFKTKNYKAGSKINQLADMLAKRSLNVVEVSENGEGVFACLLASPVLEPQPLPPPPAPGESPKPEEVPPSPLPPPTEPQVTVPPPTAFNDSENSTKEKPVKTRTSPRCRKEVDPIQTDSVARRGKTKTQTRRSKKLVEMSTQTAEIQFITIVKEDEPAELPVPATSQEEAPPAIAEDPTPPPIVNHGTGDALARLTGIDTPTFICLFCQLTFDNKTDCLNHEATHSLKRKTKFIKCQFCLKKLPNLEEFKSHATKLHGSNFHLCTECDLRFIDNNSLMLHAKLHHYHPDPVEKFSILNKKVRMGGSLDIDVRQSSSLRCPQKISPKEKTEEQLYEAEMLFYSHLSGNILENLSKHLDGKIDQQESGSDVAEPVRTSCLLTVTPSASGAASVPVSRAPSPYQTRSKTPNPLPTSAKKFKKLPNWQQKFWEKYNFPTNYRFEHRFWDKNYIHADKSPMYLKDLSCLDIKTQLTMRENVKKLEEGPNGAKDDDERLKDSFPYFLNLVPGPEASPPPVELPAPSTVTPATTKVPKKKGKGVRRSATPQVVTRRQSGMDADQKMTLRRQTSMDNLEDGKDGKETKDVVTPVPDDASNTSKETVDSAETILGKIIPFPR